jgi:ATP adenylyltransferase/5',5'''-P-1,P-4-tetraphosphate phosphorylase II
MGDYQHNPGIPINSLGFAGLLVAREDAVTTLEQVTPLRALRTVVLPEAPDV